MQTRDRDVRAALHARVFAEHHRDNDTLVLDEFGLWYGEARIDIAVVNGLTHGFEIKSDRDTLERLPKQQTIYNLALDLVTLVVGDAHLARARALVPEWWGIQRVKMTACGDVHFEEVRLPRMNPKIEPLAVAALLWCDEIRAALDRLGKLNGHRRKPRHELAKRLADVLEPTDLRAVVREGLKKRAGWRLGGQQMQDDDSCQLGARSSDSLALPDSLSTEGSCHLPS